MYVHNYFLVLTDTLSTLPLLLIFSLSFHISPSINRTATSIDIQTKQSAISSRLRTIIIKNGIGQRINNFYILFTNYIVESNTGLFYISQGRILLLYRPSAIPTHAAKPNIYE